MASSPLGRLGAQRQPERTSAAALLSFDDVQRSTRGDPPGILRFRSAMCCLCCGLPERAARSRQQRERCALLPPCRNDSQAIPSTKPARDLFVAPASFESCARHRRCQRSSECRKATADCRANHISTTFCASSRNRRTSHEAGACCGVKMSFSGQGGYFQENSDDDTRFSATLQPPQPRRAAAAARPSPTGAGGRQRRPRLLQLSLPFDDEWCCGTAPPRHRGASLADGRAGIASSSPRTHGH